MLLAIAVVASGLAGLVYEMDREERDRQAVRALIADIERAPRAPRESRPLSSAHSGQASAGGEPAGDGLQAALDRLARIQDLRILPADVDIQADTTTVDYAILGTPLSGDPPPPSGGRFEFRRGPDGWHVEKNLFLEDAPPAGRQPRRAHRHTREGLWARLGTIAVLALLACLIVAAQPMIARAIPARITRRSTARPPSGPR